MFKKIGNFTIDVMLPFPIKIRCENPDYGWDTEIKFTPKDLDDLEYSLKCIRKELEDME